MLLMGHRKPHREHGKERPVTRKKLAKIVLDPSNNNLGNLGAAMVKAVKEAQDGRA